MVRLVLMTGVVLALLCNPAGADPKSGNYWLDACTSEVGVRRAACAGYLLGFNDLQSVASLDAYCLPSGVTLEQTKHVVVKFLRDNPQRLHEPIARLVLKALQTAFPCRDASRRSPALH